MKAGGGNRTRINSLEGYIKSFIHNSFSLFLQFLHPIYTQQNNIKIS